MYKFERLEVWKVALEYSDLIYEIANRLPKTEEVNLKSQTQRACTSVCLNIAEGSTSQTDPEQRRFLGIAIRSVIETVACYKLILRRKYISENEFEEKVYGQSKLMFNKLQALKRSPK